jgi:hypothetical protein
MSFKRRVLWRETHPSEIAHFLVEGILRKIKPHEYFNTFIASI